MPIGRVGVLSRGRVQHARPRLETPEEQCARAGRRGGAEAKSAERLAAVWAERDAEIEGRLDGPPGMSYRFKCRLCEEPFSLEQLRDEHERECVNVNSGPTERTAKDSTRIINCKYCNKPCKGFGGYGRHRWEAHRAEVLADTKNSRAQRKVDEAKIDTAIANQDPPRGSGAPAPSTRSTARRPVEIGHLCPTCGGAMPETAAQLLGELQEAGFADADALEVLRIARRVLVQGASA